MYFPATCYQTLGSAFTGVNFLCWPHLSDLIHFSNQVLMLHHISSVPAQVFFPLCLPDTPAFSSCTFSCRDHLARMLSHCAMEVFISPSHVFPALSPQLECDPGRADIPIRHKVSPQQNPLT